MSQIQQVDGFWYDGCIYFVQSGDGSRYKIGRTNNFNHRMNTLQTGNPEPLTVVCCYPNSSGHSQRKIEMVLHRRYDENRVHGEWFEFSQYQSNIVADNIKKLTSNYDFYYTFEQMCPPRKKRFKTRK